MSLQKIIDELQDINTYQLQIESKEVKSLLYNLYSTIWTEACYDPLNDSTRVLCEKMLPHITRLNELLKFKV